MKFSKLLGGFFAAALLFTTACKDDEVFETKGTYENGYFISNEGAYKATNAEVTYVDNNFSGQQDNIYKANNAGQPLGDVLQSVAFNNVNAYLVVNNSNKIEVVNRYGFKNLATITSNLQQPRNIAFSGNYMYVTNNNFFDSYYVSIYNLSDLSFVKKISFDRYAEKIVEAAGNVLVQTDGVAYVGSNPVITGHTVSLINSTTKDVAKVITLPDAGEVKDLASKDNFAYALTSTFTDSFLYKINGASGDVTNVSIAGIAGAEKLKVSGDNLYILDGMNNVYAKSVTSSAPATKIFTIPFAVYGFDVIDGKIFASNPGNFSVPSEVTVYSLTGSKLASFKAGVATNGFYKN